MTHQTRRGGAVYPISQGSGRVAGSVYALAGGRTSIDGTVREISLGAEGPTFQEAAWEDIIEACQSGAVPESWQADGSCTKTMTIGGVDFAVDLIGRDQDHYSEDGAVAPLTFQLRGLWGELCDASNLAGTNPSYAYGTSRVIQECLPAILREMPAAVRDAIRETRHDVYQYLEGGMVRTDTKLFLLSEAEVFGENLYGQRTPREKQYGFYAAGGSAAKADPTGQFRAWQLRDPAFGPADYTFGRGVTCCGVSETGAPTTLNTQDANGISFAFCF